VATDGQTPAILRHRPAIEAALQAAIGDDDSPITHAARYVMGWSDQEGRPAESGGKRIRPALTLVAASAFGGSIEDALPGAVAVELIHNFSLVHDEIQDQDAERHHRPTAYTVWGPAQAINLGDYLYSRAIHALGTGGGDPSRRVAAMDALLAAVEGMIRGQWRDLEFEDLDHVTVEDYLAMTRGKTGVLIGASLEVGAILGGAPPAQSQLMGRWGTTLGLAFQAIDDYLGIWGDQSLTGKTTTGDIARKKKTLPIIHALSDPDGGVVVRNAFARDRQVEEMAAIVGALEAAGADRLCRDVARKYAGEANTVLTRLEVTESGRADLHEVAEYFVAREF
jgi:geranylgeranyl diphosphate synthase type I